MLSIKSQVTEFEATCEFVVTPATDTTPAVLCSNTWSGADPNDATGWVFHGGTWALTGSQPPVQVRCPDHASA